NLELESQGPSWIDGRWPVGSVTCSGTRRSRRPAPPAPGTREARTEDGLLLAAPGTREACTEDGLLLAAPGTREACTEDGLLLAAPRRVQCRSCRRIGGVVSESEQGQVVVIGSANRDYLIRLAHPPAPGETILAEGMTKSTGG